MAMTPTDDLRMSRARLYVLIDSCEHDMRKVVEQYLLQHYAEDEIFTPEELERAKRRRDADDTSAHESLVQYLDLQTTYDLLLRRKGDLPHDYAQVLVANAAAFPQLVPIRHRVMHGRPLKSEDPQVALGLTANFIGKHWEATQGTCKRLRDDSTWEPFFQRRPFDQEVTLHNLPEVDYDETTLIGRRSERAKLLDLLKRRRHSVLTVTGEGGIGKTALALDVAYGLLDSEDNPYEAILWVSLKTEKLTAYGIEELKGAVRGVDGAVEALGQGIARDFRGSLDDLASGLEGIDTLVIIDNLESAQGNEVVEMYDALPATVNYLFTSRWGVGQLERVFPLPPLSEPEAVLLLRRFASVRGQKKLAQLRDDSVTHVVEELRYSPLAIRWFVLASESGRVPLDVLRDQKQLLDFCVKNVVQNLSEDSRAVLTVLRALDRAIGFDEFAILTEMTIDALRQATQQLTRGSLVVVEAESTGAIAGRLALTATARSFLQRPDHSGAFIAKVLQRERQFKAMLEESFSASSGTARINVEQIVARDAGDHSAMYLLQTALTFARSQQFAQARTNIERAKSFNPEYAEVYRVSGMVGVRERNYEFAVSELKTALTYSSEAVTVARANYLLADVISRSLHDATLAVPHAEQAYKSLPCGDTAFLLGKLLMWVEEFKGAQEYIQEALDAATGRRRLVVSTVLTDSWARWSEADCKLGSFDDAIHKATAGFKTGQELLREYPSDSKLLEALFECAISLLKARGLAHRPPGDRREESILRAVAAFVTQHCHILEPRKLGYLRDALHGAMGALGSTSLASGAIESAFQCVMSEAAAR